MTPDDIARAVEEIGARLAALENTVREQEVWSGDVAMLNLDHETRLGKLEGKPEPQVDEAAALAALDPKPRGLDCEVSTRAFREACEVVGKIPPEKIAAAYCGPRLNGFETASLDREERLREIDSELRALNLRRGALVGERERLRGSQP